MQKKRSKESLSVTSQFHNSKISESEPFILSTLNWGNRTITSAIQHLFNYPTSNPHQHTSARLLLNNLQTMQCNKVCRDIQICVAMSRPALLPTCIRCCCDITFGTESLLYERSSAPIKPSSGTVSRRGFPTTLQAHSRKSQLMDVVRLLPMLCFLESISFSCQNRCLKLKLTYPTDIDHRESFRMPYCENTCHHLKHMPLVSEAKQDIY